MRYVRFLRIKNDLTVKALARLAEINRATLSLIESGRVNPTSAELRRLADALGIADPSQLLVGVDATPLGDGAESRDKFRNDRDGE